MNTTGNRIAILLTGLGPLLPGMENVPHADEDRMWVTKDGRYLRLGEMTTDHLRNAADMLRQDARQWRQMVEDACRTRTMPDASCPDDPHYALRREAVAAAMSRVIASRRSRSGPSGWFAHR